MKQDIELAIIGAGNIGRAVARGLATSGRFTPQQVLLTRRRIERIADLADEGFQLSQDNLEAVRRAAILFIAVEPQQLDGVLAEIGAALDAERHIVISVVSGATIADIRQQLRRSREAGGDEQARLEVPVVRAMPNTAIALGESMTCLSASSERDDVEDLAVSIFDAVGKTLVIPEELMVPATALCACGIAFFLRSVRAASQGGIEIGFHPDDALTMAAQTALGAAKLVLEGSNHPEREIDSVTTPRGCTISGLNEMEHQGFSSAMIKGIVTSATKAERLYESPSDESAAQNGTPCCGR